MVLVHVLVLAGRAIVPSGRSGVEWVSMHICQQHVHVFEQSTGGGDKWHVAHLIVWFIYLFGWNVMFEVTCITHLPVVCIHVLCVECIILALCVYYVK